MYGRCDVDSVFEARRLRITDSGAFADRRVPSHGFHTDATRIRADCLEPRRAAPFKSVSVRALSVALNLASSVGQPLLLHLPNPVAQKLRGLLVHQIRGEL